LEKRTITSLVLAAAAAVVLISVLVLLVRVKAAAPPPEITPGETAEREPPDPGGAPILPERSSRPSGAPRLPEPGPIEAAPPPRPAPAPPDPAASPAASASTDLDRQVAEASEFYGRGDYPTALERAVTVLQQLRQSPNPDMVERVLRIAASSSCFLGEAEQARLYHAQLSPRGQRDIEKRCRRVGIEFR
jgi:hypothetical protein